MSDIRPKQEFFLNNNSFNENKTATDIKTEDMQKIFDMLKICTEKMNESECEEFMSQEITDDIELPSLKLTTHEMEVLKRGHFIISYLGEVPQVRALGQILSNYIY